MCPSVLQVPLLVFCLLSIQDVTCIVQPTLQNLKTTAPLDYDTFGFAPSKFNNLSWYQTTGYYNSTGQRYSAFVAVFSPTFFAFYPPKDSGCVELVKPSESSVHFDCEYATNGGFFTWNMPESGSLCIGDLISDSFIWQAPIDGSGTGRANFGVTSLNTIVTGFIDANVIATAKFAQLITGWGWLVRNGQSYVSRSPDLSYEPGGFTYEKAPRTAVGYFRNGSMALVQVDGEEDILYGPDLFELADLLVSLGLEGAVNMDGGGSSVSVYDGEVVDEPTCNDTPEICEREVASFACVKKNVD